MYRIIPVSAAGLASSAYGAGDGAGAQRTAEEKKNYGRVGTGLSHVKQLLADPPSQNVSIGLCYNRTIGAHGGT